jgi:hypothetical protein
MFACEIPKYVDYLLDEHPQTPKPQDVHAHPQTPHTLLSAADEHPKIIPKVVGLVI